MFSRLARRQISYKTDKDSTQTSDIRAKLTSQDSGNCEKVIDCVIPKFSDNWQVNKSAHCTIINHEGSCQEDADNLWVNTMSNDLRGCKRSSAFYSHPGSLFSCLHCTSAAVLENLASEWRVVSCLVLSVYLVIFVFHCPNYLVDLSVVSAFATKWTHMVRCKKQGYL